MYGVFAAVQHWAHWWKNSLICFITDNNTVHSALNTGKSKCKDIMFYLQCLFWLAVDKNVYYKAVYIKSADNVICDPLSRLNNSCSVSRILRSDAGKLLCCNYVFSLPFQN